MFDSHGLLIVCGSHILVHTLVSMVHLLDYFAVHVRLNLTWKHLHSHLNGLSTVQVGTANDLDMCICKC